MEGLFSEIGWRVACYYALKPHAEGLLAEVMKDCTLPRSTAVSTSGGLVAQRSTPTASNRILFLMLPELV